jgi:small subunit ribosomal protein S2
MNMAVTAQQVIDAQAHIGSLKSESHPKTSQYWSEVTNGLVIMNPETIAEQINSVHEKLAQAKKEGKEILVACEKQMYAQELEDFAKKGGYSFLNYKISGGFMTNFSTFKKRIDGINEMAAFLKSEAYSSLTKKEQLIYRRKFEKVNKVYKGVVNLKKRPDIIVVVDGEMLNTLLDETENLAGVETIVIASSNFSRYWDEKNIIMANVNSHKSIDFVIKNILS